MNATIPRSEIDVKAITTNLAIHINRAILGEIEAKPNSKILNLERVNTDVIKAYILEKHTQEWARRSVGSADGLEQTAKWFEEELNKFYAFVCLNPDL